MRTVSRLSPEDLLKMAAFGDWMMNFFRLICIPILYHRGRFFTIDGIPSFYYNIPMGIRKYGDKLLTRKSEPVQELSDSVRVLIADMKKCLAETPGGIGLAAPQVGILQRAFILDLSLLEEFGPDDRYTVINPEITSATGASKDVEGCLSFPGITTIITRPDKIELTYRDEEWNFRTLAIQGYAARAFQHEIDHLDGILIIDRVSPIKKRLIKNEIRKRKSENEW
jgi:peptide deformylase